MNMPIESWHKRFRLQSIEETPPLCHLEYQQERFRDVPILKLIWQ